MRFIVEGGDHIGWFVIDTEDGNRVMDDRPSTEAEAVALAQEYEPVSTPPRRFVPTPAEIIYWAAQIDHKAAERLLRVLNPKHSGHSALLAVSEALSEDFTANGIELIEIALDGLS